MKVREKNPGWFREGYDPRRHVLTKEERARGGKKSALRQMQTMSDEMGWGQDFGLEHFNEEVA